LAWFPCRLHRGVIAGSDVIRAAADRRIIAGLQDVIAGKVVESAAIVTLTVRNDVE